VKKLALVLALLAGPALAQEAPKPTVWLMVIQIKASTLNVTYPSEDACKAGARVTAERMKKLGRVDCLPVVQP
jgi:hypothetical protein